MGFFSFRILGWGVWCLGADGTEDVVAIDWDSVEVSGTLFWLVDVGRDLVSMVMDSVGVSLLGFDW